MASRRKIKRNLPPVTRPNQTGYYRSSLPKRKGCLRKATAIVVVAGAGLATVAHAAAQAVT